MVGGKEIISNEGTTESDPAIYAIDITPLIDIISELVTATKLAAFTDDITAVGKSAEGLKSWWQQLITFGLSFGYLCQPKKSWLIVNPQHEEKIKDLFQGA